MPNPKIQAYADASKVYQDAIDTAIDGLVSDIDTLNAKITELQNTPPELDAADQLLLDDIQARGQAAAERLAALDNKTASPPVIPVVE